MKLDAKTVYAQSSDIRARTYLEYRKDMKKKAIAELEVLEWLEDKVKELYPKKQVNLYKSGGDKFLWFLRKGGVSRDADFIAEIDDEKVEIEFQYGGGDIQEDYIFDFKTSKVGKKVKGKRERTPKNINFLYLFKEAPTKFAFIPASWILKSGVEGVAPAWGNREVYKITGKQLLRRVKNDPSLQQIWNSINAKLFILDFQHELIDINKEKLSHLLQGVIDENNIVKIIPKDLDSFFKVCFILDNINKIPQNANLWFIYLLSYINNNISLEDISKITYCIDFLYSKIELKPNELTQLISKIKELFEKIKTFYKEDGSYISSLKVSPLDETRYALFSINLLEDLIQDEIFYYSVTELKPIKKIYENIGGVEKTYKLVKNAIGND
ncbi:MAG: hypothetical protein HZC10_06460 [Nitrospirae bacterium]|nr:hypothetical protein [Nitrospirota bacterium]